MQGTADRVAWWWQQGPQFIGYHLTTGEVGGMTEDAWQKRIPTLERAGFAIRQRVVDLNLDPRE